MSPSLPTHVLAPFKVRGYRLLWPADLLTSCAFEMETLILGWYVLVETQSVLFLTVFGALQYGGTLIAPMLGVVGDRIGRRNLLCGMRAVYAMLATALMLIALGGALNPTIVMIATALLGLVRPSDIGVRSALTADFMPVHLLVPAMGSSRTTSDFARVLGALTGAGLFATFGIGPAYAVVVVFYTTSFILTAAIRSSATARDPQAAVEIVRPSASPWSDFCAGLAYVWSRPYLLAVMWLAFLVNLSAYPLSNGLLPYVAREVYHVDETGLGYLAASFAVGSLLGSIAASQRRAMVAGRVAIVSCAAWYCALLAFAHSGGPFRGGMALFVAGLLQSICMVALNVILLRTTSPQFRGRVMGVRMMAIYSLPIGLLTAGALVELAGFRVTATLYAGAGLLFTLLIGLRWRHDLSVRDTPANAHP